MILEKDFSLKSCKASLNLDGLGRKNTLYRH